MRKKELGERNPCWRSGARAESSVTIWTLRELARALLLQQELLTHHNHANENDIGSKHAWTYLYREKAEEWESEEWESGNSSKKKSKWMIFHRFCRRERERETDRQTDRGAFSLPIHSCLTFCMRDRYEKEIQSKNSCLILRKKKLRVKSTHQSNKFIASSAPHVYVVKVGLMELG